MKYLIDTDWSIQCLHAIEPWANRVRELEASGIGLSVISLAEIYEGVIYSKESQRSEMMLQNFLEGLCLVPIDSETCRIFAHERGRLRSQGNLIQDFDLMIAATAIRHDLTLLTNNRRHFARMDGVHVVSV